jgi:hypothetical protein
MRELEETDDIRRILALPRRSPEPTQELADALTELLRVTDRCEGVPDVNGLCSVCEAPMRLKPLQALALHDIGVCRGGFLSLDVGEGKTLISLLAFYVLGSTRSLLMLPANLIEKTRREQAKLMRHWLIPNHILPMSYQMLGRVPSATWLEDVFVPDLVVFDESQKVKDPDSAVTKRFERLFRKRPETCAVAMTGTIMRKSIKDFAPSLVWCLKDGAPVPRTKHEQDEIALALDEKVDDEFARLAPGPLLKLATPEEIATYGEAVAARRGFKRRLRETPGVVCSAETGTDVGDVKLTIRPFYYALSSKTHAYFQMLREDKQTPDGTDIMEAVEVWRHARELALGYYQIWDPPAPEPWRKARKEWYGFVREILSRSRTIDSPEHVAMFCDAGKLDGEKLAAWRAIEPSYTPSPKAFWHDDSALHAAAAWMREPGIVWVEHVAFGERLAQMTGAKYYGPKGKAADGEFIDDADPRRAVIAAVKANREGRNLQRKWWRNLVTAPTEGADLWQQLIGRTHRPGQSAPEVVVDIFLGCAEHARAVAKARLAAASIRDTVGSQSKLLTADMSAWPSDLEIASWSGPLWDR